MAEHIIDAFVTKFVLDRSDYQDGVKDIEAQNKRLREGQKKTFDDIEQTGRRTGEAIKGVTREVVGLGLAFMGAKSISGFVKDMMTGAASADRFGQTLNMNVRQVWAWRQAMQAMGGDKGEGDAALQRIQSIKMGLATGNVDASALTALGRLGVSLGDLQKGDAGDVLQKLSGASGKMNPQLYASLLQQVGLPQSTIYFLQQGQAKVDEMLQQFSQNADQQEALAKQTEDLQAQMAELNTKLQSALIPILIELVPTLQQLVGYVAELAGHKDQAINGAKGAALGAVAGFVAGGPVGAAAGAVLGGGLAYELAPTDRGMGHGPAPGALGAPTDSDIARITGGRRGGTRADRNNNPGNIIDSPFARSQPGYVGSDGRFARFASADHGYAAMEKLLGGYMKQGRRTISSIVSKWAPASENNVGAYVRQVSRATGLGPNQVLGRENIAAVARAMAAVEGHSGARSFAAMSRNAAGRAGGGGVNIGSIVIHTQARNGAEIARALPSELRKRGVIMQADRVMAP